MKKSNLKFKLTLILSILLFTTALTGNNVTLCYHQFDYSLHSPYSVLPEVFQWQMNYLKANKIKFVSLQDMLQIYSSSNNNNIGTNVFITFDDGWKNEMNVLPIIDEYKIPVELFIFPEVIGNSRAYFSLEDIAKLKKNNLIDFGCHSYTHKLLVNCSSNILYHEVLKSQAKTGKIIE